MTTRTNRKADILIAGGLLLLAAALCITLCHFRQERRAAENAERVVRQIQEQTVQPSWPVLPAPAEEPARQAEEPEKTGSADFSMPETEMPMLEVEGELYIGTLSLPSQDKVLPVMGEWNYAKLNLSPCRFSGSVYLDDMIIGGHNYSGHFGCLTDLAAGDKIIFSDAGGKQFFYTVAEVQQLGEAELASLMAGDWDLTLFTCTFSGRDRVAVRCERQK